ncbi:MAG: 50S ribosomal protein L28 [Erysipelotrichia bacterium]|nr:50S ribosomal protein L28 [Erysipelotrichia bacterium]
MSRVCAVSGKKAMSGNARSHSLRATRRKWNVNLQKVHMIVDGKPTTVRISARAMKTLKSGAKKKTAAAAAETAKAE